MTAGPMTCMDCGGVLPTHNAWCDALRPRPVPAPAEPSAPCPVCEAAHAFCRSGAPASTADFIKSAIVQERKAKEAAEAERDRLRDEVRTLRTLLGLSQGATDVSQNEVARLRAALSETRSALDTTLEAVKLASAILAAERDEADQYGEAINHAAMRFILEYRKVTGTVESQALWSGCKQLLRAAFAEFFKTIDARRAAEPKPADPAVFTHRPGCHHANPDHGKGHVRCRCACFCPRPESEQRAAGEKS